MTNKEKKNFNIIALVLLSCVTVVLVPKVLQNDTFYTIKIGNYILKHGIDMLDHFSCIPNLSYTYPHWLFDIIVAIFYNIKGFTGTYILTMIFAVGLVISIYISLTKLNNSHLLSLILSLISMWLIMPFIALRAQVVSYSFFVILVYNIYKYLEDKAKYRIVIMFFVSVLIANIHAATWPLIFILFLPFLVEQIIVKLFLKIKKDNKFTIFINKKFDIKKEPNTKYLWIIFIILLISGLITPIGSTPFLYTIKIFMGNTTKYIHEHNLTIFNSLSYTLIVFVPLVIFLIFNKKIRLRDFFMLCGLLILTTMSRRHIALLSTIGMLSLSFYVVSFVNNYAKTIISKIEKNLTKPIFAILLLVVIVVPYIPLLIKVSKLEPVNEELYPIKASAYFNSLNLGSVPIFNDYNNGSYLMLQGINPFMDSRSDLYTKPFNKTFDYFDEYIAFDRSKYKNYDNFFNKYNINFMIIKKNLYLSYLLVDDPNYQQIYNDEYFYIFKKIEE